MKTYKIPEKNLPVKYSYDVVVCGGGTAGVFAAIAAAEQGKSVILIEQFGSLGGTATNGLVTPFMHNHIDGCPSCSYITENMRAVMNEMGGIDETGRAFDPMIMRVMQEKMCADAGVKIVLHTFICDAIRDGGRISAIVAVNKDGYIIIEGKYFIDATGDGDVSVLAGAEYQKGNPENQKCQPISLRYIIGGVDIPAVREFFKSEVDRTGVHAAVNFASDKNIYASVVTNGTYTMTDLFDKAITAGDLTADDKAYWQMFYLPGRDDCLAFNNPEFFDDVDATNNEHLTRTQLEGKQRIFKQLAFYKKYFKGFERAYIADIAAQVGIRESRHIGTEYILTAEDLICRHKFDDAIAQSCYPVDIHGRQLNFTNQYKPIDDGRPYYEVPYRSIVVKGIDNLFITGRCLGAEFLAQSSLRIQLTVRSSGEAAGIAAALALDSKKLPRELDGAVIRDIMISKGAVFSKI